MNTENTYISYCVSLCHGATVDLPYITLPVYPTYVIVMYQTLSLLNFKISYINMAEKRTCEVEALVVQLV
jgi:hypothetical protein